MNRGITKNGIAVSLVLLLARNVDAAASQPRVGRTVLDTPYFIRMTIEDTRERERITQLIAQRRWPDAINLCQRIAQQTFADVRVLDAETQAELEQDGSDGDYNDEWNWQAMIGELYLYNLQPQAAVERFSAIRQDAPLQSVRGFGVPTTSNARRRAAAGLARAYADLGKYAQAVNWLKQSTREEWNGCGNCAESIATETYVICTVWRTAGQPGNKALLGLQRLMRGSLKPQTVRLQSPKSANRWQKRVATTEAALALGQMRLRQGKAEHARALFQAALTRNEYDHNDYIAATNLDRLTPQSSRL